MSGVSVVRVGAMRAGTASSAGCVSVVDAVDAVVDVVVDVGGTHRCSSSPA